MTIAKRQKRIVGDIVKIPLDGKFHAYARVLGEATFAIYDGHTTEDMIIAAIVQLPILFRVAVMDYAVKKGRWIVVGNLPLDSSLAVLPAKFIQDPINKDRFSIYQDGKIRHASRAECVGLDRASVWDPEHVEDRIRDYYAGKINKWLELDKLN